MPVPVAGGSTDALTLASVIERRIGRRFVAHVLIVAACVVVTLACDGHAPTPPISGGSVAVHGDDRSDQACRLALLLADAIVQKGPETAFSDAGLLASDRDGRTRADLVTIGRVLGPAYESAVIGSRTIDGEQRLMDVAFITYHAEGLVFWRLKLYLARTGLKVMGLSYETDNAFDRIVEYSGATLTRPELKGRGKAH